MAPYATDLIAQKRDLEKRRDAIDPFQKLNPIDAKSPHSPPESTPETPSNADNANASNNSSNKPLSEVESDRCEIAPLSARVHSRDSIECR